MEKKLAKIESASLSMQERGILTFWITVKYEDGGYQSLGGMTLDEWSEEKKRRIGTTYGCEMIRRTLVELGVDDFSKMKGKHIWVYGVGKGFDCNVFTYVRKWKIW